MTGERAVPSTSTRRGIGPALLLAILVALFAGLLAGGSSAAAQEDDDPDQAIRGRVLLQPEEAGSRDRPPVPDVHIIVTDLDGNIVGDGTTDEAGNYAIGVPAAGDYLVRIDTEALPDDLEVAEERAQLEASVRSGQTVTRVFFLGESTRVTEGRWSVLPQTLANGFKLAMIIAITSIGLSLIFGTTGLSNFAHGEMVTFGAIVAFWFNRSLGLHLVPAAILAVLASALLGAVFDLGVWRPLRGTTSLTSLMIVSIGVALATRYVFLYLFGADVESYRQYTLQRAVDIGPVAFTRRSLWVMGLSLVLIVVVSTFLLKARFGKAIRAVSDNPDLASSTGIDTNRVILIVWILGGALTGVGGVFYGLEFQVRWDMGFTLLLLMFAAITLGGLGNPFGALVGSLVVGIFVELWTWIVSNANDLKTVGALIALIVILLIKPQGLLGTKERIG